MKIFLASALIAVLAFTTQNCSEQSNHKPAAPTSPNTPPHNLAKLSKEFAPYWYAGVAELCSYDVVQERYGEIRQAEQVNIFVTEDLSASKQVKLDNPAQAGTDRVPVLKLNSIRRFQTGIYDYSIMQSVFTPVGGQPSLKVSTSIQDWCGHVFSQYNLTDSGYRLREYSYFESEGDHETLLAQALLEDEIWTRIRLDPSSIPTGKMDVIPAALYNRFQHQPCSVQKAEIQLQEKGTESLLSLRYTDIDRSLTVRFNTEFPHEIRGWEELSAGNTISKGTLKAIRRSAYWGENNNVNEPLRDSLQLRF